MAGDRQRASVTGDVYEGRPTREPVRASAPRSGYNIKRMKILPTALIFAWALVQAESINPAPKPQTAPMSAQEKKNLDKVLGIYA